ncbi:hypothetical protein [uncultured Alistipes sp.]|mgnify:CR=1 FL=1|uniref:hypothetical protein n=1 Tax=uncultured Alistipes sp. TaxID=538949 RepID=UPI0026131F8A|nr:hypothetical protein [uncultured Alistipes sp.]
MKTLYLPLKKEWYEMIECGEKKEEYRQLTQYWMRRLCAHRNNSEACPKHWKASKHISCEDCANIHGSLLIGKFDAVCFSCGYTNRRMTFECDGIKIGQGHKEWGAPDHDTFIIKLGRKI